MLVDSVSTEVGVNYLFEARSQFLFWSLSFVERLLEMKDGWAGGLDNENTASQVSDQL